MMDRIKLIFFIILLFLGRSSAVYADTLLVGMSTALTGPTKKLGQEMKQGIGAYFWKINQQGGINGNLLKLIALDDMYEPYLTKKNMRRLTEDKHILAIIGNVGTPTANAAIPIANKNKTLFFGAFTGADSLRKEVPDRYVFNYRASYQSEINLIMDRIFKQDIKSSEIGLLIQDDAFGNAGFRAISKALTYHGITSKEQSDIAIGYYVRNTENIHDAMKEILKKDEKHNIKAFVIIGTYAPSVIFIKLMKSYYPKAQFYVISFTGTEQLKEMLCLKNKNLCKEYSREVYSTQTVPPYNNNKIPVVKEYNDTLMQFNPDAAPNPISLEGFIVAKIFVRALEKAENNPTRESILSAFENLGDFEIGLPHSLSLSATNHQAYHQVWLETLDI